MKRWLMSGGIVASLVVVLVVAVVVGVIAAAGGTAAGDSSGSPSPTASPSASAMVPTVTVEKKPVALFVGDSYTVGQGSSAPEKRWSTIVADKMGWAERNEAQGGTGYVSRSVTVPKLSYGEQLRAASKDGVDVVVIAGGQNDFPELEENPELVFSAVKRAFRTAHQKFPDARIIAVGPSTPWDIGLEARALDSAVRAAAEAQGATYVSLIDPDVVLDQYVHEDGIHVTDEGYAAIARRVISQIS